MPTWTETRLWKQLTSSASPERPSIEGLLQQWMPDIERVLNAGTSPLDFTLHDAEHSFRVAEWMAKIVPDEVLPKLSAYELTLLLLSAYLHDIGMTPEQARVQRHWRHLVFGPAPEKEGGLSPEEAAEFQRWLDDERDGLVPPLAEDGKADEDDLRRAAELITYYARHKHNDWSEEWIRRNAKGYLGSYEGWIDDLVRLCQSHHEGYAELKEPPFNPRPAGRHGEVVHLRYLACVLRVADILDVDPERTPPVLFQHRDIALKSVIYWRKDHDFWVRPDGSTLVVHARPLSAIGEKAARDTAEWIRLELETCARLGREKPFSHSSFQASEPLQHRWSFPESLALQVRPRNDDYVYIDGAFRPNTAKLLELLSGIQLYKEPLVAVRELLQNAFDAVKEQIALKRLEGDPADEKRTKAIIALQSVELRFEEREGRFWLLCTDTGVGMTRSIIEKYLLVSGNSRRHDILELERQCEAAGFNLGRTGQFGIGVLSYFMLADSVEIRTRRSSARGDAETHGWWFQTEGVGTFGELRKDFKVKRGTTVGLRLRQDVIANREEFLAHLQKYLLDTLLRVPCSFQLTVEGEAKSCLRLEAGWQALESRIVDGFLGEIEDNARKATTAGNSLRSSIEKSNLALAEWSGVAERFRSAIRWETEVGQLPRGLGQYRLSVPFFNLPGGRSGLFFDFDSDRRARLLPIVDTLALELQLDLRTSFQGVAVNSAFAELNMIYRLPYLGEIDWEESRAGRITVDRTGFSLTTEASEAASWLKFRSEELQAKVLSEEPSEYAEMNAILNPLLHPPSEAWWFVNPPDQEGFCWEMLSLPVVDGSSFYALNDAEQVQEDSRLVSITQSFEVFPRGFGLSRILNWCTERRSRSYPRRLAVASVLPFVIIPQYVALPRSTSKGEGAFRVEFPAAWSSLAALVSLQGTFLYWFWNRDHPLVRAIEVQDLEWFSGYNSSTFSEELLQTKGRSALYLMTFLDHLDFDQLILGNKDSLDYRLERQLELAEDFRRGFWQDLWDCVGLDPAEIVLWAQSAYGDGRLCVLGLEGMEEIHGTDPLIPQYLADPGDEWKLTITYKNDFADGA